MDPIDENNQCYINLSFKDENGDAVIPTSFIYKIEDIASDTVIKANTTINPGTASYNLTITSTENRILNAIRAFEQRRLTVEWYSGATRIGEAEYIYKINNLKNAPLT